MWPKWWSRRVREAQRAGARDGQATIPATEGVSISPWEQRLVNDYEAGIKDLEGKFRRDDRPFRDQFDFAEGEHRRARAAYENKYEALKRPILIKFSPFVGKLLILAAVLVELPLNRIVFSGVTGESEIMAWMLALLVSIFLAVIGHLLGIGVRHHGFLRRQWLFQISLVLSTGAVLAGIAYVRVYIFSDPGGAGSVPLLSKYVAEHMDVRMLAIFFMVLNGLLVMIAGWIAHECHDPDEEYQAFFSQYRRWSRKAGKIAAARERSRAPVARKAAVLVENAQELLTIYRQENLHAREFSTSPTIWAELTPERLISMDKYDFSLKGQIEDEED